MPVFSLVTNLPKSKISSDFLKKTAELVAETLGKPLERVMVHVTPDAYLSKAGATETPCAFGTLKSIGCLTPDQNIGTSARLFAHIEETLGIPGNMMTIFFEDVKKENTAHKGTTWAEL